VVAPAACPLAREVPFGREVVVVEEAVQRRLREPTASRVRWATAMIFIFFDMVDGIGKEEITTGIGKLARKASIVRPSRHRFDRKTAAKIGSNG
jgi:hypothetical protein